MGTESLLIHCAEVLRHDGHDIRGILSAAPPIRAWAEEYGVACFPFDDAAMERLAAEPFDYFFSVTNVTLLPPELLALPRKGAINFHPGPLPRYAGLNAPSWAIINGETSHGVTWHTMAAGVDTGEILKQETFPIAPDETALTLNTTCFDAGLRSFRALVSELVAGCARPVAQDFSTRSYFGKNKRPAGGGILNFNQDARALALLVRGLQCGAYENPLATAKLRVGDDLLIVQAASGRDGWSAAAPGTVTEASASEIRVATAAGELALTELARLDGTPLPLAEAIETYGLHSGYTLPTPDGETEGRLTALAEKVARSEPFWATRLLTLAPAVIPYAEQRRPGQHAAYYRAVQALPPAPVAGEWSAASAAFAAFVAYLARIGGQQFFHVGYSEPALRDAFGGAAGLFAQTVPFTARVDTAAPFAESLAAGLDELQTLRKRFTYARDLPLRLPALAALRNTPEGERLPIVVTLVEHMDAGAPVEGSTLTLALSADGGACAWIYDPALLEPATVEMMQRQFATFLCAALADPTRPVADLPLVSDEDRRRLLVEWNDTARDYPRDRCIHQLIEEQAVYTPDAVALICDGERLSYRELNARANKLAHHLRGLGVGPDRLVGICVERSLEMVVAILGTHKAGGGYVPLDPAYPAERIAYMLEDAAAPVLLTQVRLAGDLRAGTAAVVCLDTGWAAIETQPDTNPNVEVPPDSLAYVIYTSGSTGKPKGVMVEHRNVVNFFAGMDERIELTEPAVWLALTSLSFDISVLELMWTLARGFTVVLFSGDVKEMIGSGTVGATSARPLNFSLMFFASDPGTGGPDTYKLLMDGARFADAHGFEAVWTPERHFHEFGGIFPNPSVTSAALAAITERVKIRAGSCVLPLHSPIRVAEEWSFVDVLSQGRVGISFAAGWQPNDFVLRPENFADAKNVMVREIDTVRRLWRGETLEFPGHDGHPVALSTLPRPVQPELPFWLTAAGNPETFRAAGRLGANLLTHLLGQSLEEVGEKIAIYRQARAEAGHPGEGHVTLMLHTFLGEDEAVVRETVRAPMKNYLKSSVGLIKQFATSFPAFRNLPEGTDADQLFQSLSEEELDALLEHAFNRYYETSGLFGTPEQCVRIAEGVRAIGVDEIACLVDYGVAPARVMESLELVNRVKETVSTRAEGDDSSVPALIERHGVTHLQCTPSTAMMLLTDPQTRAAFCRLRCLMIGGEAFPAALAADLATVMTGQVINMYGPTETTIWSTTNTVEGTPASVSIGTPLANQRIYVLDERGEPTPVGVPGELFIAGDGVVRGYLNRPELTAERFVADPFATTPGARMYRTGDLARWLPDGTVDFLGRLDHQVKIRGFRIELGEIEHQLNVQPGVRESVVIAREDTPGDKRLVAYVVAAPGATPSPAALREGVGKVLPEFMVPSAVVFLDKFPLTPNAKIDRKALPRPDELGAAEPRDLTPPTSGAEESIAAIWREVLKLPAVGVTDNFFDLGGNSLLIVQVHRRMRSELNVRLSLTDMFRLPTIRALASFLDAEVAEDVAQKQGTARAEMRRGALLGRRGGLMESRN